jgi:hypothetical protein
MRVKNSTSEETQHWQQPHKKMTAKILGILLIAFCLTNCDKKTKMDRDLITHKTDRQITEAEIYSTLEYIITEQKLNKDYGLKIIPAKRCDSGKEDKEFLSGLIITTDQKDSLADDSIAIPLVHDLGLQKCLTKEEVDFMLSQKKINKEFKWNNSKLGFNLDNHDNWYEFSVPLFNKDKSKAIFLVSKLCKGLCGTEQTFLVEINGGVRTFKTGYHYIH